MIDFAEWFIQQHESRPSAKTYDTLHEEWRVLNTKTQSAKNILDQCERWDDLREMALRQWNALEEIRKQFQNGDK